MIPHACRPEVKHSARFIHKQHPKSALICRAWYIACLLTGTSGLISLSIVLCTHGLLIDNQKMVHGHADVVLWSKLLQEKLYHSGMHESELHFHHCTALPLLEHYHCLIVCTPALHQCINTFLVTERYWHSSGTAGLPGWPTPGFRNQAPSLAPLLSCFTFTETGPFILQAAQATKRPAMLGQSIAEVDCSGGTCPNNPCSSSFVFG